jgi:hypothetical protein
MSHLERAKQVEARLRAEGKLPAAPGIETALDLELLEARYRALARRLFHLASLGPDADPGECAERLSELVTRTDDLGPHRLSPRRPQVLRCSGRDRGSAGRA